MLKTIALKMLFTAINLLVTKDLLLQVKEAVVAATTLDLPGADKKELVKKELADVKDELKKSFKNMANAVLEILIESTLLQINIDKV